VDDLIAFLRAQLDEDERIARAATPGPWRQHDTHLGQYGHTATVLSGEGNDTELRAWLPSMSQESWDETRNVWNDAVHITQHDPARVLREIDAKRGTIDRYEFACNEAARLDIDEEERESRVRVAAAFESCVLCLAVVYADRPGYLESWRP
jgi:hypothetical protein